MDSTRLLDKLITVCQIVCFGLLRASTTKHNVNLWIFPFGGV